MEGGWFKVYWKLQDSIAGSSATVAGVWVLLLCRVSHRNRVLKNGTELAAGEALISEVSFANDLDISRKVLRRIFNVFEKNDMIKITKRDRNGTRLSVCQWRTYQDSKRTEGHKRNSNGTATELERNLNATQTEIPKSPKSPKKGAVARFAKPSIQEIQSFASSASLPDHAQEFFDYYESNGWQVGKNTMRDWKAAYRGWCRRQPGFASGNGNRATKPTATPQLVFGEQPPRGSQ